LLVGGHGGEWLKDWRRIGVKGWGINLVLIGIVGNKGVFIGWRIVATA